MKTIVSITFALLLCCSYPHAQEPLVPYLAKEIYGFANSNAHLVIDPQFSDVGVHYDLGIICGKTSEGWVFYTSEGKEIFRSVYSNYRIHSGHIDYMNEKEVRLSSLVVVTDTESNRSVVFNPRFPENGIIHLEPNEYHKAEKNWMSNLSASHLGIFKVSRPGQCNFMDTTGTLLLPRWIDNGFLVARNYVVVDSAGLFGLYDLKLKSLTPHVYHRIVGAENTDYFSTGYKTGEKWIHTIIDTNGRTTLQSDKGIKPVNEKYVLVNSPGKWGMYKYDGSPVFEMPDAEFEYSQVLGGAIIKYKKDGRQGWIDMTGNEADLSDYKDLRNAGNGNYFFTKGSGTGVLSSDLKEKWFIDSLSLDYSSHNNGYYKSYKKTSGSNLYGLIDTVGNTIFLPVYDELYIEHKWHKYFVIAGKKGQRGLYTLSGENIIAPRQGRVRIEPNLTHIYFITENAGTVYDQFGKEKFSFTYDPSKYDFHSLNAEALFLTPEGSLIEGIAKSSKSGWSDIYSREILVAVRHGNSRWSRLFREYDRQEIKVPGYGLPDGKANRFTGSNGCIILLNKEEFEAGKEQIKAGVIDFKGNWLIPPSYQVIKFLYTKLIWTRNTMTGDIIYYNRFGKKLSSPDYELRVDEDGWSSEMDRILIRDKKTGLYGYIDTGGNKIVAPQYNWAHMYMDSITTAGLGKEGHPKSFVLDYAGHRLLTTLYDSLHVQKKDPSRFSFFVQGKSGLIDIKGKVLIEPLYDKIQASDNPGMWVASVGTTSTVFVYNQKVEVDQVGRCIMSDINKNFIQLITHKQLQDVKISVFDKTGNFFGTIPATHLQPLEAEFNSEPLPVEYATMKPSRGMPYVIHLPTMKAFRD